MLKAPKGKDGDRCPRCESVLEPVDELRIGNECWKANTERGPSYEEADEVKEDFLLDCPNCTYCYP